jgi:hypothetical protein
VVVVQREYALLVAGIALFALLVSGAVVVPGALADRGDDVRPGQVALSDDVAVSPVTVTGETATLGLDVRLTHRGGPAENVTVEVRATDAGTGLLVTTREVDVGTLTGEREVPVRANVTVPREGNYDFEVFVYQEGRRVAAGTTRVAGVGSLTPAYARTSVQFEEFEGASVPAVTYSVVNASDGRVELATRTHFTNAGDERVEDLTLVVLARQAESNIVADRRTVDVGGIRPGRTEAVEATLSVPDDYNYRLDAILQRDGVVLAVAGATAELAPTRPLPDNATRERVEISASDFQRDDGDAGSVERERAEASPTAGSGGPGFTGGAALVALVAATIVLRRYT